MLDRKRLMTSFSMNEYAKIQEAMKMCGVQSPYAFARMAVLFVTDSVVAENQPPVGIPPSKGGSKS